MTCRLHIPATLTRSLRSTHVVHTGAALRTPQEQREVTAKGKWLLQSTTSALMDPTAHLSPLHLRTHAAFLQEACPRCTATSGVTTSRPCGTPRTIWESLLEGWRGKVTADTKITGGGKHCWRAELPLRAMVAQQCGLLQAKADHPVHVGGSLEDPTLPQSLATAPTDARAWGPG